MAVAKDVPRSPSVSSMIPAIITLRLPKRMKSQVATGEREHVSAHANDDDQPAKGRDRENETSLSTTQIEGFSNVVVGKSAHISMISAHANMMSIPEESKKPSDNINAFIRVQGRYCSEKADRRNIRLRYCVGPY